MLQDGCLGRPGSRWRSHMHLTADRTAYQRARGAGRQQEWCIYSHCLLPALPPAWLSPHSPNWRRRQKLGYPQQAKHVFALHYYITHLAARLAVTSQPCFVPQNISTLCPPCTVSRASRAQWSPSCIIKRQDEIAGWMEVARRRSTYMCVPVQARQQLACSIALPLRHGSTAAAPRSSRCPSRAAPPASESAAGSRRTAPGPA